MKTALNQPYGLSDFTGEAPYTVPAASPAPSAGVFDTILGTIKDVFRTQVPIAAEELMRRTMYGRQPVYPSTIYQPPGAPGVLAPKAPFPTEYLLLGAGAVALFVLTRKRGKR